LLLKFLPPIEFQFLQQLTRLFWPKFVNFNWSTSVPPYSLLSPWNSLLSPWNMTVRVLFHELDTEHNRNTNRTIN